MKEGRKEGSKEARKQGSKEARKQGSKEGQTDGRREGGREGRKQGRKEWHVKSRHPHLAGGEQPSGETRIIGIIFGEESHIRKWIAKGNIKIYTKPLFLRPKSWLQPLNARFSMLQRILGIGENKTEISVVSMIVGEEWYFTTPSQVTICCMPRT